MEGKPGTEGLGVEPIQGGGHLRHLPEQPVEGGIDLPYPLGFLWKLGTEVVDMGAQIGILADLSIGEVILPGWFKPDKLNLIQEVKTVQDPPDPPSPMAFPYGLNRNVKGKALSPKGGTTSSHLPVLLHHEDLEASLGQQRPAGQSPHSCTDDDNVEIEVRQ